MKNLEKLLCVFILPILFPQDEKDMASFKDSFYVTLPSHDPNKIYVKKNKPNNYMIMLPDKLNLKIQEWKVDLAKIFLPDYTYNMKHLQNESLKNTYS